MSKTLTCDTLFDGELKCYQHKDGYRFSVDPILLAHFTQPKNGAVYLDIGCGSGIISLLLYYRHQSVIKKIEAIELQTGLATLAKKNTEANGYQSFIHVRQGDVKDILSYYQPESFDNIVCNPPYYSDGDGRQSTNEEVLLARHQIAVDLNILLEASSKVLKNRGIAQFIYPSSKIVEILSSMDRWNFQPKRLQIVYNYPGEQQRASMVLIEAMKNGGRECAVEPPFYVYEKKNGDYSKMMQKLYQANFHAG